MNDSHDKEPQLDLHRRLVLVRAGGLAATSFMAAMPLKAQPHWVAERPIKMVVPFAAGGGLDVVARIVSLSIGSKLGQPIVVDNRPGASGAIGSQIVGNAAPDGYTIMMASADTHSIYPHVYTKSKFAAREFVAVSGAARLPYVLMARPDFPVKTVGELVALGRSKQLSYATWGPGSGGHISMVMFRDAAKLKDMLHVPYSGGAPAVQALMASQVDVMMVPIGLAVANRSRLSVYGTAALKRSDAMPDVPTLAEQGFPVNAEFWIGVLAPPKTPSNIVAALSDRVREAVADPEVQKQFLALGMTPHVTTQPEFARYVASEYDRWGQVIKASGIRIDD